MTATYVFCEVGTWFVSIFKRTLYFRNVYISRIVQSVVSFSTHALDCRPCQCVRIGEVNSAVFWSCGLWRGVISYVDTNVLEGFRVKTSGLKLEAICSPSSTEAHSSDIRLIRFYKRLLDAIRRCCIPILVVLRFLCLVPCIIGNIIQRF